MVSGQYILGDPGAASRDEAIFSGESLLQERKGSPALKVLPARCLVETEPKLTIHAHL